MYIMFESLDIKIANREFLDWYNDMYGLDEFGYGLDDIMNQNVAELVIECFKSKYDLYRAIIKPLNENDEISFRSKFWVKVSVRFETPEEINLYKLKHPERYSELVEYYNHPLQGIDYGKY